jgi:hypothetical protein
VDDNSGSTFNTYENLRNVTFVNGTTNAQGESVGVGVLTFNGGNLRIVGNSVSNFDGAMDDLENKMAYIEPSSSVDNPTSTTYRGSGEIEIDSSAYPWKGTAPNGKLTINANDVLVFHVDSSQVDPTVKLKDINDDPFELTNGYVAIDPDIPSAITLNGGKMAIINDDVSSPGILPAHSDFWLIRSSANADISSMFGGLNGITFEGDFEEGANGTYKLKNGLAGKIFNMSQENDYAEWDRPPDVYLFSNDESSGLFLGTGETPCYAVPSSYALDHANEEIANISVDANDIITDAIFDRMTSVKGCLADPFIHVLYGHGHQNEILGFGYNNNMGGFALGADNIWNLPNERYLRMGIVYGYVHGKTKFFGPASGLGKSVKHDIHTMELFAAYEFFNDQLLKTNLGITLGYSHIRHRLHRVDFGFYDFNANMRSNSVFANIDFVKNLFVRKGYNFGLWLRGSFYHVNQSGYDESSAAAVGSQHISGTKHDIFTTVLGLNIEKEFLDDGQDDRKLTLSLKSGWECHAIRKYSHTTATFDNRVGIGEFTPTFGHADKHAAIISIEGVKKLNNHWNIVGFYVARFNRDIHTHNISSGVEYSF